MPEPIALVDGEPTFELMGRDPFAPALIRLWVAQRRQDVRNGVRPVADLDQIERAERTAERMETWRSEADEAWRSPRLPLAAADDVDGTLYTPGEPEVDNDGWIAWGGGECPVTEGTRGQVKFADGRLGWHRAILSDYTWKQIPSGSIIAYRVVTE